MTPNPGDPLPLKFGVDLSNCDREPIHIPGSIQPHGMLLAFDDADMIRTLSRNVSECFHQTAEELIGTSIAGLIGSTNWAKLQMRREENAYNRTAPIKIELERPAGPPQSFDGILHKSDGLHILELEPISNRAVSFQDYYESSRRALSCIRMTAEVTDLCQVLADEVRLLTGFDRVMVYRFDRDWHGEVLAEARRDDLEPFLGLHYPASDIPTQARRLYEKNWLRLIENAHYEPIELVPELNPLTQKPLDLTYSVLRSVSPIHRQYLRNMGVAASMSISLLKEGGGLWGLVACHHYSPRLVPYEARLSSEYLGQTLSLLISSRERLNDATLRSQASARSSRLLSEVSGSGDIWENLRKKDRDLMDLTGASGVALVTREGIHTAGLVPPDHELKALLAWLQTVSSSERIFASSSLSRHWPEASQLNPSVAGLLAARIGGRHSREWLLWVRPEAIQTIDWAGDPKKISETHNEKVRLSPRGSFALWRETVRGEALDWHATEVEAAQQFADSLNRQLLDESDRIKALNAELNQANILKDEFLATMSHELRTPLNSILSWVDLMIDGDVTSDEYPEALEIIRRNARSQHQLIEDLLDVSRIISGKMRLNIENVMIESIVSNAVDAVKPALAAKNIKLNLALDSKVSQVQGDAVRLQQIVWNILSNAVKFTPMNGRITVKSKADDTLITISVSDSGIGIAPEFIPHVFERFKQADGQMNRKNQGLGLGLAIARNLTELHGGTISVQSPGLNQGTSFSFSLPIMPVERYDRGQGRSSFSATKQCPDELDGLRILIVDDEADARSMLSRILKRCGAQVFEADGAEQALAILAKDRPDLLISDLGMPVRDGISLIKQIRSGLDSGLANIPAIALTAFARAEERANALRAGFTNHLPKPVSADELYAVISSVCGRNLA